MEIWSELERPGPDSVDIAGVEVCSGSRVLLRPHAKRDAWDALLNGRAAVVERIEEDTDGVAHVVVTLTDDPARQKFFFAVDEVEPVVGQRILVAGIGNVFLGDDGFGCAVAAALADVALPGGVELEDFGVRGLDLAYALAGYDAAILVDALPVGDEPGTIVLVEPTLDGGGPAEIETHGMDPARVLRLAAELGALPTRVLVVGCQPEVVLPPDADEVLVELSPRVRAAVDTAASLVLATLDELTRKGAQP